MTSTVRRVAGGLTVVEALWMLYSYNDTAGMFIGCPVGSGSCIGNPSIVPTHLVLTLAVAAALVASGALGIWGASFAFPAGGVLSAVALVLNGYAVYATHPYGYLSAATDDALIGVAFALVALLVNFQAIRTKSGLSEQANPMNLPVFG